MQKRKKNKLFVPGPVNTAEGMENIPYFRDSKFADLVLENEKFLMKAIGCKRGRVIPYTLSGTGAMDAIITNLIDEKDKILVIDGGTFGKRWHQICNFYKKNVISYFVKFGKDIDIEDFKKFINKINPTVILMQHHETSSGQLHNVKKIGQAIQNKNILFVVDAMCSFLTDVYDMDEFRVDITLISTQKGLQLDAGISSVVLNEKTVRRSAKIKKINYYNNFDTYLEYHNLGRGQAPFTPAVKLTCQLNKKLRELNIKKEIKNTKEKAEFFRKKITGLPLKTVAETPSNFLTGLLITDKKYNTEDLNNFLKKENIFICPTTNVGNYLENSSNKYFRVAHTGCDKKQHKELIKMLRNFFKQK